LSYGETEFKKSGLSNHGIKPYYPSINNSSHYTTVSPFRRVFASSY